MLITFLEDLKESLFNHSNCSHPSLEVVVYLFLPLKGRQSSKCTVPFSSVVPLLSLAVTHYYLLSLVVTRCITRCHSWPLVAPLAVTRCHSLSRVVPLVVTRCTTRCHSLSFVVTRCTTRLSFYKGSSHELILKSSRDIFFNLMFPRVINDVS